MSKSDALDVTVEMDRSSLPISPISAATQFLDVKYTLWGGASTYFDCNLIDEKGNRIQLNQAFATVSSGTATARVDLSSLVLSENTLYTIEISTLTDLGSASIAGYDDEGNWVLDISVSNEYSTFDTFEFTTIPEPSTYGILAGVGLVALAMVRRRKK